MSPTTAITRDFTSHPSVLLTYYIGLHTNVTRSLTDELIYQVDCITAKLVAASVHRRDWSTNATLYARPTSSLIAGRVIVRIGSSSSMSCVSSRRFI